MAGGRWQAAGRRWQVAGASCSTDRLIDKSTDEPAETVTQSFQLSDEEQLIMKQFEGGEVLDMDRLIDRTGKSSPELASALMLLELKHLIVKRFDGTFEASLNL